MRGKAKLSLRTEQDLVAAEPADAGGIGGNLEPIVVLIEDAEFRAVVDGEGSAGVFKRTAADGHIAVRARWRCEWNGFSRQERVTQAKSRTVAMAEAER